MAFKYTGDLSSPIPSPKFGLLMTDDETSNIAQSLVNEQYRRMRLLFDAHGVRHGDWEALCFALAENHVPGLKIAKAKAGRPKKWDDFKRAELAIAIEQIVRTGKSITEATEELAVVEPWKSLVAHTRGAETLRDEYSRTDERHLQIYRNALAFALLKHGQEPEVRENP